jgi:hypothetical protein
MEKQKTKNNRWLNIAVLVVLHFFVGCIVLSSLPNLNKSQVFSMFSDMEETPESEDDTEDTSARQPFSDEEKLLHDQKNGLSIRYLRVIHRNHFFNNFTSPHLSLITPPPKFG